MVRISRMQAPPAGSLQRPQAWWNSFSKRLSNAPEMLLESSMVSPLHLITATGVTSGFFSVEDSKPAAGSGMATSANATSDLVATAGSCI